jgi:hypothetical protein
MSCVEDQEVLVKESLLVFLKDNIPQANLRLDSLLTVSDKSACERNN